MYNPRWPHTFSVYSPSLDERGLPITDSNGNPQETKMVMKKVVYDSAWNPVRNSGGSFRTDDVTEMPWGYRTSTGGIKDSGEVFAADYKISCPMMLTHLPEGTVIVLTDYDHSFCAVVKKQTTYNWGTNIWLDNPGNNALTPASFTPDPPAPEPPTPDPGDGDGGGGE